MKVLRVYRVERAFGGPEEGVMIITPSYEKVRHMDQEMVQKFSEALPFRKIQVAHNTSCCLERGYCSVIGEPAILIALEDKNECLETKRRPYYC